MRWQRPVRYLVAVAGIGFAWFLYSRFNTTPQTPKAAAPPAIEPGASFQSKEGRTVRIKNGKEAALITYGKLLQYPDGRKRMEKVEIILDRADKPYRIFADVAESRAPAPGSDQNAVPEETHLMGHVVLKEEDGMEISCEDGTYRDSTGTFEIPGAVSFVNGRMSGKGIGAAYERQQQLLNLRDQSEVTVAPDETGGGRLATRAKTILLNRLTKDLTLDGDAVIVRDRETLGANHAQMHLTDDEHGVQYMQLRARSRIEPAAGATGAPPEMRAEDINIEFHPDGRTIKRTTLMGNSSVFLTGTGGVRQQIRGDGMDVQIAPNGQTVTNLVAAGGSGGRGQTGPIEVRLPGNADFPDRNITARQLNASGTEKTGLNQAVFTQDVVFKESRDDARGRSVLDRSATARNLTVMLNTADLSDIKEARFRETVVFRDGATTAKADEANYVSKTSRLELRPTGTSTRKCEVDTSSIWVEAKSIDLDLAKIIFDARGAVKAQTKPTKPAAGAATPGLFEESKPLHGVAETLMYDDEKGIARYSGAVTLYQGANRVRAESVSLDDATHNLVADGKVETQFTMDNLQDPKGPPTATATKFEYKDAERSATYTGTEKDVARFTSVDGTLTGLKIVLKLGDAGAGRELLQIVADGSRTAKVTSSLSPTDTATGEHLQYDVADGKYVVSGRPAIVLKREKTAQGTTACSEMRGAVVTFLKATKTRPSTMMADTGGGPPTRAVDVPCPVIK
jgi:lipopolysaccharide export system protein LptA